MKFYIASGFRNKSQVQHLSRKLTQELGWCLTYDWTQNIRAETVEELQSIGEKEFKAILEADLLIVVLPGGKGCHTELGIALGSGKEVLLFDPYHSLSSLEEATTFYFLPQVKQWNGSIEEISFIIRNSVPH